METNNINCGGMQLIFVGDYQSTPVPNKEYDDGRFSFEKRGFLKCLHAFYCPKKHYQTKGGTIKKGSSQYL